MHVGFFFALLFSFIKKWHFSFSIHIHVLHQLSYSTRVSREIIRSNKKIIKREKLPNEFAPCECITIDFDCLNKFDFYGDERVRKTNYRHNENELWHQKWLLMFIFFLFIFTSFFNKSTWRMTLYCHHCSVCVQCSYFVT